MGALALTKSMTILSDPVRRNVLLLAICQAVSSSGTSMLAAVAALVGYSLVDDKSFATLPLAFQWIATMATTIPAAQLMRRFGRRAGLSFGAIIFMTGGAFTARARAFVQKVSAPTLDKPLSPDKLVAALRSVARSE